MPQFENITEPSPAGSRKPGRPASRPLLEVLLLVLLALLPLQAQSKGLFKNSLAMAGGLYAAEGFGSNLYLGVRYNHYFSKWKYFIEASLGTSSIKSPVLEDLAAFQVFDSEGLLTYEFLFGYDMRTLSGVPYLVIGVAGVNQGGQSRFSYVVGLGKHIPLAQFFKVKRLGVRYDIRDHMFRQQINDSGSFWSHNLIFTLGLQYFF